jgi:hypothetical protein
MRRSDANDLVKKLLPKYEKKLPEPTLGKTLFECWDPEKRRPSKEYQTVIKAYKRTVADLGVDIKPEM